MIALALLLAVAPSQGRYHPPMVPAPYVGGGSVLGPLAWCVITQTADDATPSVGVSGGCTADTGGNILETSSANTGPLAITDLDSPVVGMILYVVGTGGANPSTIADGGNFNLERDWEGLADNVLELYVQADNDYVEVTRHNGPRYFDGAVTLGSTLTTGGLTTLGDDVDTDGYGVCAFAPVSDVAPDDLVIGSAACYAAGTQTASSLILHGGEDEMTITVDTTGGNEVQVEVTQTCRNAALTTLVEGTDFACSGLSDAVCAANLATAIAAQSGTCVTATSAAAVVYPQPIDCEAYGVSFASANGGGGGVAFVTSNGTDGQILVQPGTAALPGLASAVDPTTGLVLGSVAASVSIAGVTTLQVASGGVSVPSGKILTVPKIYGNVGSLAVGSLDCTPVTMPNVAANACFAGQINVQGLARFDDSIVVTNNVQVTVAATTDADPGDGAIVGPNAWARATGGNRTGGSTSVAAGIGTRHIVCVNTALAATDEVYFDLGGTQYFLIEGTSFDCHNLSAEACCDNLGVALNALRMTSDCATTAGTCYITPDGDLTTFDVWINDGGIDGEFATTVESAQGDVDVYGTLIVRDQVRTAFLTASPTTLTTTTRRVITPGSQELSAAETLALTSEEMELYSDGGAVVSTADPALTNGSANGEIVCVMGTSDANRIQWLDEAANPGSTLELAGGVAFDMGLGDRLCLRWYATGSKWYETTRSAN
jgi:hypothetical protein